MPIHKIGRKTSWSVSLEILIWLFFKFSKLKSYSIAKWSWHIRHPCQKVQLISRRRSFGWTAVIELVALPFVHYYNQLASLQAKVLQISRYVHCAHGSGNMFKMFIIWRNAELDMKIYIYFFYRFSEVEDSSPVKCLRFLMPMASKVTVNWSLLIDCVKVHDNWL